VACKATCAGGAKGDLALLIVAHVPRDREIRGKLLLVVLLMSSMLHQGRRLHSYDTIISDAARLAGTHPVQHADEVARGPSTLSRVYPDSTVPRGRYARSTLLRREWRGAFGT
jgi:hypothetical protein